MDGLAGVGERVDPGDVYINKQSPTNANDNTFTGQAASVPYKNTPMTYKSPISGNIDKVMITDTENDQTLIKVLIRQTRRPELGDKFSSRKICHSMIKVFVRVSSDSTLTWCSD
jgi:DNA-directed RNA polymerase III subunit RPC2